MEKVKTNHKERAYCLAKMREKRKRLKEPKLKNNNWFSGSELVLKEMKLKESV